MIAVVLGGGFGLYGYLPALLHSGYDVCLPRRYQDILRKRKDGQLWFREVQWAEDDAAALNFAEAVIIAKPPQYQVECVKLALTHCKRLKKLFLEKPLAPTPDEAMDLYAFLCRESLFFKIAYLFLYTSWVPSLKNVVQKQEDTVFIRWSFMAHHFRYGLESWKKDHYKGGGVLRFYAIHLLAVVAFLGYSDVLEATMDGEARRFFARFSRKSRADLVLEVDSGSVLTGFLITTGSQRKVVAANNPFMRLNDATGVVDYRVEILSKYLSSPFQDDLPFYERVLMLWAKTETKIGEFDGNSEEKKSKCFGSML